MPKVLKWRTEFVLWARFELNDEERALVRKYDMERGYLTIEGSWRDFRRASLYAVLPALVLAYNLRRVLNIVGFAELMAAVAA